MSDLQVATRGDRRKILVSGASIAGLTTAYWLRRYGFSVVVVEKAESVRTGGYPIDIRGTAVDVVERMDLLPRLRDVHIDSKTITFLDDFGEPFVSLPPEWL